jgi:hypothetical protein
MKLCFHLLLQHHVSSLSVTLSECSANLLSVTVSECSVNLLSVTVSECSVNLVTVNPLMPNDL